MVLGLLGAAALTGTGSDSPSGGAPSPVQASAPPHAAAQAAPCTKVLAQLPLRIGRLDPRVVHTTPDTPYVAAWGDPPVILACGVDKPKSLHPGSAEEWQSGGRATGPFYAVTSGHGGNTWTTVDRGPYIAITVPAKYQGADVLPPLSDAIAKALPAVCSTDPNTPDPGKLCTRRSN